MTEPKDMNNEALADSIVHEVRRGGYGHNTQWKDAIKFVVDILAKVRQPPAPGSAGGAAHWQCCPVCRGRCYHPHGFYSAAGSGEAFSSTSCEPEKCKACDGQGIIASTPVRDSREWFPDVSEQAVRIAVNHECTCGGRIETDPKACPACMIYHRLYGKLSPMSQPARGGSREAST